MPSSGDAHPACTLLHAYLHMPALKLRRDGYDECMHDRQAAPAPGVGMVCLSQWLALSVRAFP